MKFNFTFTALEKKLFLNMLNGKILVGNKVNDFTKYKDKIDSLMDDIMDGNSISSFYMDFDDFKYIKDVDEPYSFQEKLITKPMLYLDILNYYYTQYIVSIYGEMILQNAPFYVRIKDVPEKKIEYNNVGKLITIQSEIDHMESVKIILDVGKYQCKKCKSIYSTYQQYLEENVIPVCTLNDCINQKFTPKMELLPDESIYTNFQYGWMKNPDSSMFIHLFLTHDLVNTIKRGDKVKISGVFMTLNHLKVMKHFYDEKELKKYEKEWKRKNISPALEPILIVNAITKI